MSAETALTNKPPNASERRVLEAVAKMERDIAQTLERQIAESSATVAEAEAAFTKAQIAYNDARAILEVLTTQHSRVVESLKDKERLFHPLRGYPSELLSEIFSHCSEKHTCSEKSIPLAIALSQVCRDWRTVAHSTAELWQFVDIDFTHNPDPLKRAVHWVEHSGNRPLHISLVNVPDTDNQVHEVTDTLLRAGSRWRTFSITTDTRPSMLQKLVIPTPQLTTLRLHATSSNPDVFPTGFLPDCPQLRTMDVRELWWAQLPFLSQSLQSLKLVWSQNSPPEFLHDLSRLPDLQSLDLQISWDSTQTAPPPSSFSKLTTLALEYKANQHFGNSQAPLAFSNLQDLTLDYLESTDEMQLFFCFLRHIPHPELLNRLVLTRFDNGSADDDRLSQMRRAFACAIGLQTLRLENSKVDNRFLDLFSEATENPPQWLCPSLEQLEFKSCDRITDDALIRLINARGDASREATQFRPSALRKVDAQECEGVKAWRRGRILDRIQHYQS